MNLGMGGAGFSPSAMDAYSALLGRVPSMIDESLARKRAKSAAELKGGELDRRIKKETYEKATGPQLAGGPTQTETEKELYRQDEERRKALLARAGRLKAMQDTYGGPQVGGNLGATAVDEMYSGR